MTIVQLILVLYNKCRLSETGDLSFHLPFLISANHSDIREIKSNFTIGILGPTAFHRL